MKSPPCGSGVPIAIPRFAPPRPRRTAKSRCPTSVADYKPQLTNAAKPATFEVKVRDHVSMTDENLFILLDNVRRHETIYKQAGAVHGCALADTNGQILMFVEDVGRHNAVDAIAGFMWLDRIDGADKVFYTTGRLTSEMVIKCAQMRIPFLVSRSGLTQMGHEIASKVGMTMLGPATGKHYPAFTARERLRRTATQATVLA